ncbi:MAG TPA: sigma-70 family RNA polymerase sigma factor [Opitutaceae bacterium]|nr:sigma-70 family RNA polymerase sigma factor [Opitutaceae bacterium]
MIDDTTLLRRYAAERAEDAFAEFVRRHLPLVYSAALRRLGGDVHRAQDVAQVVFCAAAREAHRLSQHALVTGWLYTATRNAVIDVLRAEKRRRGREQEAHHMYSISSDPGATADWSRLGPVLDAAMDELSGGDREAVLLRFFQNRPFAEIGRGLGLSEDAARKRVERALEKLGTKLRRHGISSTSAALAALLASETACAAPAGLVASITGAALGTGAAAASAVALITSAKLKVGIAAAVLAAGAIGFVAQQRTITALREDTAGAHQQLDRLAAENRAFARARAAAEAEVAKVRAELLAAQKTPRPELAPKHLVEPARAVPSRGTAGGPPSLASPTTAQSMTPGPLPDTPEIRRRRAYWHHRYDPFFRGRGLSAAEGERFVELKIHQEIEWKDFQAAVRAANLRGDSQAVQALRSRDVAQITRGLYDLLGRDGYTAYLNYETTSAIRELYVEPVEADLAAAKVPLSSQQAEQLLQVFAANDRYVQARPTDIGTTGVMNWDAVLAQAATLLTPAQVTALQTHASRRKAPQ